MLKRKVYIFNGASRAAVYGIGTYIEQLIDSLKDTDIEFNIIYLFATGKEITIQEMQGYRQISIPAATHLSTTQSYKYYSRNVAYLLKEFIHEEKGVLNIFHLNFMGNPDLVSSLKKTFKCKIILVAHYTDWSFSLMGNYKKLKEIWKKDPKEVRKDQSEKQIADSLKEDMRMIKKCDKLVCVANHTFDAFYELCGVEKEKKNIINNALKDVCKETTETKKTALRRKYFIEDNSRVIFFAGRLDPVKGLAFLIKSFQQILKLHPDARLFIAGDGDFNQWLKIVGNTWSKITFTGKLDRKQLYELYRIADVGIVCSIHEEFGFTAIEMMMHRVPLIVSDTGGLAEIIEDNKTGLKVPVRTRKGQREVDVKKLTEKIDFILNNALLATELGNNGRQEFLNKYELSLFREKMLKLYNEI